MAARHEISVITLSHLESLPRSRKSFATAICYWCYWLLVETMLRTRPHPEHGYRACLSLMSLAKRFGGDRVTAACERALAIGGTSYRNVGAILKNGLDKIPVSSEP